LLHSNGFEIRCYGANAQHVQVAEKIRFNLPDPRHPRSHRPRAEKNPEIPSKKKKKSASNPFKSVSHTHAPARRRSGDRRYVHTHKQKNPVNPEIPSKKGKNPFKSARSASSAFPSRRRISM
jgi:hypothetical protein